MRPIPIKDSLIKPGTEKIVISAPNGDLTDNNIRPVEATLEIEPSSGLPLLTVMCTLEDDDLEKLIKGGFVMISFLGHMVPFEVFVIEGK